MGQFILSILGGPFCSATTVHFTPSQVGHSGLPNSKQGQIATVKEIQQGFEKRVKSKVEESTIYRLLDRHKWRKL
jgi:hypothetical protein